MEQISFLNNKSKIELAIERIKTFEPSEGYYLAFSGGKDSIVCYHLLKMAEVKFDGHYNVTGLDHPELIYTMKKHYSDIKFEYPRDKDGNVVTMWKLIEKKMLPPTMIVRYCCSELKEKGGENRFVITGVRWAESTRRKNSRGVIENFHKNKKYKFMTNDNDTGRMMMENCIKKGKLILNPIVDWEDYDVWNFIKDNNFPYPDLYDKGWHRLGCIGCPMSGNQDKELTIYPKIKKLYFKAFEKMLIERKRRGVEKDWETPQQVYDWWISHKKSEKVFENQVKMEV